jgi:hypothetical protein
VPKSVPRIGLKPLALQANPVPAATRIRAVFFRDECPAFGHEKRPPDLSAGVSIIGSFLAQTC